MRHFSSFLLRILRCHFLCKLRQKGELCKLFESSISAKCRQNLGVKTELWICEPETQHVMEQFASGLVLSNFTR